MRIRDFLLLCVLALPIPRAFAADLSDLWFNPSEPGWGATIVQQDNVAFAILFVYGQNREPDWYIASDAAVFAYSSDGLPHISGMLHRSRGPWFAADRFNPIDVDVQPVGDFAFEPINSSKARITYRIGSTVVSKEVVRLTWRLAAPNGAYDARFSLLRIVDGVPLRVYPAGLATFDIRESGATMTVDEGFVRCNYQGAYTQSGRLGTISGTFACQDGRNGTFAVKDLEFTTNGFSGRFEATENGVVSRGRFGGPRR